MANRRMFSKKILQSDDFTTLPVTSQLLYFQLALASDDEGFNNMTRLMLVVSGATEEDLELLIQKGYLLRFESGVTLVVHWYCHNQVRPDRFQSTQCHEEKARVYLDEHRAYRLNEDETPATPLVANLATQVRLGEVREDEVREDEVREEEAREDKLTQDSSIILLPEGESEGEPEVCPAWVEAVDAGKGHDGRVVWPETKASQPARRSYGPTGRVFLTTKEYKQLSKEVDHLQRRIRNFDSWLGTFSLEGGQRHYDVLRYWDKLANADFVVAKKRGPTNVNAAAPHG